jgi:hypothetical protein
MGDDHIPDKPEDAAEQGPHPDDRSCLRDLMMFGHRRFAFFGLSDQGFVLFFVTRRSLQGRNFTPLLDTPYPKMLKISII